MNYLPTKIPTLLVATILTLFAFSSVFGQATIVIQNADAAGAGFNDTTPATPVGGNNGTTIGEQRLIAFQAAANIWGATLTSGPTITIRASWAALPCTASSGTLGSAGNSGNIWREFPGSVSGFWYGNALANALSATDRNGTDPELTAQFNVNLGTPGCLEMLHWYYGLDNNHGATGVDLVNVLLHEFAHGLGFQTFTNKSTGQQVGDMQNGFFPTIYDRYLFDNATGKTWPQMTDAERASSAINTGGLAWNGPQVFSDAPGVLSGTPRLRVNSPGSIAGNYTIGTATFGPALTPSGVTGNVVQATPADGCTAIGSGVSGKIALIDRGTCNFTVKVSNAQAAGAIGVIVANNTTGVIQMSGTDSSILIPSVMVSQVDGDTIKGQLGATVNATLFADTTTIAGTDAAHRPLMFAPNPLQSGSSVSHWDPSASPNQLMEPNISSDLFHSVTPPRDLTFSLLRDIGWKGVLTIFVEEGTTQVAALDSVTHVRGPFSVLNSHNFSADGRTRLIFFTTDLGLNPSDDLSVLSAQANGIPLTLESAGPFTGLAGTSYIVVKLPDLPQGNYALTVTLRGVTSNPVTLKIQ
jgi:hypothetical protein